MCDENGVFNADASNRKKRWWEHEQGNLKLLGVYAGAAGGG